MAVNLAKYQDTIAKAWKEVTENKDKPNWALYGYEGNTNVIKVQSTGSDGFQKLVEEFNCSQIQYAFCRVIVKELELNRLVLINWQGESAPLSRKGLCASHVGDIASYFKGSTQTITIRNDDDATVEYLIEQIKKVGPNRVSVKTNNRLMDNNNTITPTPRAAEHKSPLDQIAKDRASFWKQQEEEERQRIADEKKRAAEKQAEYERERKIQEQSEAKKMAEKAKERELLAEACRASERKVRTIDHHSSIASSSSAPNGDDDDRVGSRSELIRLERNQETQALIRKGSTKDRLALFEKASQSEKPAPKVTAQQPRNAARVFKTNEKVHISKGLEESKPRNKEPVSPKPVILNRVEPIKEKGAGESNHEKVKTNGLADHRNELEARAPATESNTAAKHSDEADNCSPKIQDELKDLRKKAEELLSSPPFNCMDQEKEREKPIAITVYDYQAADTTEISFDPNDLIGFIDKVDEGWWHGVLLNGRNRCKSGLFPSNYVQELR